MKWFSIPHESQVLPGGADDVPVIDFPVGYNGVTEIGLAVGADEVNDASFVIRIPEDRNVTNMTF